jgi:hypothetical protein
MAIKQRSSRKFGIMPSDNGDILEIGPAGTSSSGGVMAIQFVPDVNYSGSVVLVGKVFGTAAQDAGAAFMPISYRRVTVNNVASDYSIVSDAITGATTIQVPSNGISIGLLVTCSAGSCQVVSMNLQGSFPS